MKRAVWANLAIGVAVVAGLAWALPAVGEPHRHPPGPPVLALPALAREPDLHVYARGVRRRPLKLALPRVEGPRDVASTVGSALAQDLKLTGLFQIVDGEALAGLPLDHEPLDTVDPKPWGRRGAEAVLKGTATALEDGRVHLEFTFFLPSRGPAPRRNGTLAPTLRRSYFVSRVELASTVHRLGNDLVEEFSGTRGSLGAHLVFSATTGRMQKGIFRVGVDGADLEQLAAATTVATAPAYGPEGSIYYAGARADGSAALFRLGVDDAVLAPTGRVLGAAFGVSRLALVVGDAGGTDLWVGDADGRSLRRLTSGGLNMHPAWGPHGELAYVSTRSGNPQVFVDGRRVSTRGTFNTAPTWCNDVEGLRLVFMGRDGVPWDIFSVDPIGGPASMTRLTGDQGANTYPACSPDGREIAFFSTRPSGSGIYVMTSRGTNQQRISTAMGESLRWEGN